MICLHQPWLRFRHREVVATQMANPKSVPWRGRSGAARPISPSGCPQRGHDWSWEHLWSSAPGIQVHQHLHARYQHCFGATRLERPLGALGQHTPTLPRGWACPLHDATRILTTLHCHLDPRLGGSRPHTLSKASRLLSQLQSSREQKAPDLSRHPVPQPLHRT